MIGRDKGAAGAAGGGRSLSMVPSSKGGPGLGAGLVPPGLGVGVGAGMAKSVTFSRTKSFKAMSTLMGEPHGTPSLFRSLFAADGCTLCW